MNEIDLYSHILNFMWHHYNLNKCLSNKWKKIRIAANIKITVFFHFVCVRSGFSVSFEMFLLCLNDRRLLNIDKNTLNIFSILLVFIVVGGDGVIVVVVVAVYDEENQFARREKENDQPERDEMNAVNAPRYTLSLSPAASSKLYLSLSFSMVHNIHVNATH